MADWQSVERRIARAERAVASLRTLGDSLLASLEAFRGAVAAGKTAYTLGNGGSAAQALHLAEELVGKYSRPRPPIPAVCLNADPTALTCIANDFGYEEIFARSVRALAGDGDAVVAFSTSGNSANVVRALEAGQDVGAVTIGVLGRGGGEALAFCDHAIVVPMDDAETVQEAHQVVLHLLVEAAEASL